MTLRFMGPIPTRISLQRSLARMNGLPCLLEVGKLVLVRKVTKGKEKVQGALWAYAAEIIAVEPSKYLYQLRWATDGPLVVDKLGSIFFKALYQVRIRDIQTSISHCISQTFL